MWWQAKQQTLPASKMHSCMPDLRDLNEAKAQYLSQQGLHSELREVVSSLQVGCQKDQDIDSQHAGLPGGQRADVPSEYVVASAAKHLQAATLAQHLQLPDLRAQQNPFSTLLDTSGSRSSADKLELSGTKQHLLGVTAQLLRQTALPSRKAAQRTHAPLLPVLERRLNQNAKAAAAAIKGPCLDDQPVVQKVQQLEAAVGQLRQTNMQQLQEWHTEAAAYVQELESIHGLLQQLVGQCMVQAQPKIIEAQREYAAAHMRSTISKMKDMQLQILSHCYSEHNLRALTTISQHQQQMEQELQDTLEQAESMLLEYTQLGGEFEQIVHEFGDTMGKIGEVDHVLQTLTQVEEEWQQEDHNRSYYS